MIDSLFEEGCDFGYYYKKYFKGIEEDVKARNIVFAFSGFLFLCFFGRLGERGAERGKSGGEWDGLFDGNESEMIIFRIVRQFL